MVSQVDYTVPVFGNPTTASVRNNFLIIYNEITALQDAVGITVPIAVADGGTGATTAIVALLNLGALPIAGGTMTGPLVLSGNPTDTLGAATKQYVDAYFPVSIVNGGTGANNPTQALINLGGATLASPTFTGLPSAPTQPGSDSSNLIATTAFVHAALSSITTGVVSITPGPGISGGGSGAVTISLAYPLTIALGGTGQELGPAALDNLAGFTIGGNQAGLMTRSTGGTYSLTTLPLSIANGGTGTTTAAGAAAAIGALSLSGGTMTGPITLASDAVNPFDPVPLGQLTTILGGYATAAELASYAPLTSPNLGGIPTAPTAALGTSTTQIATTAFVMNAMGSFLPLSGGTLTGNLSGPSITIGTGGITTTGSMNVSGNASIGGALGVASNITGGNLITENNIMGPASGFSITGPGLGQTSVIILAANTTQCNTNLGVQGTISVGGGINSGGQLNAPSCVISGTLNGGDGTTGGVTMASNNINVPGTAAFVGGGILFEGDLSIRPFADNNGSVGVGGQAFFQVNAYNLIQASDPRSKKNMTEAPAGALDKVLATPVMNFNWENEEEGKPLHTGWDASKVKETLGEPCVVVGQDEAQTLGLSSGEMIAFLWKAVQELNNKVTDLVAKASAASAAAASSHTSSGSSARSKSK
jgi:hypothetical protein